MEMGDDTYCCACPMKLNEHARKVDNAGSLNLMTCFGVEVAGDRAWLCSACRRNYGRHKSSGGTKRYLMTEDKREARMRRHIRKRRKQEAMAAATTRTSSSDHHRTSTASDRAERASLRSGTASTSNSDCSSSNGSNSTSSKKARTSSGSTAVIATSDANTSLSTAVSEPITTPRDHGLTGPVLLLDTLTGRLFAPSGAIHFGDQPSYPMNAMNMMMTQYHASASAASAAAASQMYNNHMANDGNGFGAFAGFNGNHFNSFNSNHNSTLSSGHGHAHIESLSIDNGELGDVDAADIISFNNGSNGNESDSVLVSSPSSSSGDDIASPPPPFVPLSPSSDDSSSSTASSPVNGASSSPMPQSEETSVAASLLSSLSGPTSPMPLLTSLPAPSSAGALIVPTSPLSLHPIGSCNIGTSMFGNASTIGMPYGTTMLMPAPLQLPMPLLLDQDVDASPFNINWPVDAQPMSGMMPFTVGASLANKNRTSTYKAPLVKTASLRQPQPIIGQPVASSSLSLLPSYDTHNDSPVVAMVGGTSRGIV